MYEVEKMLQRAISLRKRRCKFIFIVSILGALIFTQDIELLIYASIIPVIFTWIFYSLDVVVISDIQNCKRR